MAKRKKWSSHTWIALRDTVPAHLYVWLFYPLVPHMHHCHSSIPYSNWNDGVCKTCFPETKHSAPFEFTHLLILHPSTSIRHNCISFYVSASFENSPLTEQGIILTLLVNVKLWQYHRVVFLDKVLESFNNFHMSQWIYFDGLPQK